ncbi:hypothetical protein LCGC14_2148180 [marine sediment metagenome]|uniref:Uncharacterized protein n=1 Tax=marine sediment metagenome TaxID=412755 RepID=A0A0F9DW76_9ZZZZ
MQKSSKCFILLATLWLISGVSSSFIVSGSLRSSPPPTHLNYSWEEIAYSKSRVLLWVDDSYVVNDSGSFNRIYETRSYKYNVSEGYVIKEESTVYFDANFTSVVNVTTSGNSTINIDIDAYQVNLDYGQHVKFLWFAAKNGTLEYEYYISKRVEDYSYYEENHRYIESTFEKINLTTWKVISAWNDTTDVYEELNVTHTSRKEGNPFYVHSDYSSEFVMPLFLTIQIYKTQRNDRIAWANMFFNLMIYKDEDQNGILTVGNEPTWGGIPGITSSTEWKGFIEPVAQIQHRFVENNVTVGINNTESTPKDKTLDDIISSIVFSPPVEVSETEVSWEIQYPDFPLNIYLIDTDIPFDEWYLTPNNATYDMMSPTNLSYGFDFSLNNTQADFDITWGIGKLTNDTAYNAVQGYGLVLPQYNFFLSSFDIDEVNQHHLSAPRDKFTFQSNNTVVAEINMGKPGKENYTLYDFPSLGIDTELLSIGGSIHKNAIGFASRNSYYGNPLMSTLFSLDDIVAQDTSFVVVDDLFSMETQNYPIWNGEKLEHDPSLSIYFAGESSVDDSQVNDPIDLIPSYNLPIIIGVVSVVMVIIMKKLRTKHRI